MALAIVVSFFLSPFVVNKLGSVAYGIWALILQFTSFLNLFDFGLRDSVVRYTSKYCARGQSRQLSMVLTTAMLTYVPIVLGCVVITAGAVVVVPRLFDIPADLTSATRWAVLFTGLTIAQSFIFNAFYGITQGLRRYDIANLVASAFTLLRAGAIVAVLASGHGIAALALTQFLLAVADGAVAMVVARRLLRRSGVTVKWIVPKGKRLPAMARRVFGYGAYSLLHSLGNKVVFSTDAIVVGLVLSVQAVTPYSIAGSLIQYLRTILASAGKVFIPAVSELNARGRTQELGGLFVVGSKFVVITALPVAGTLAIMGHTFVSLWMGPAYAEPAGNVLAVLAVTQVFSAPNYIAVGLLYGISRHNIIAWLRLIEAAFNIGLSVLLARWLGLVGVALGTAIPHLFVVLVVLPRLVCPLVGIRPGAYLIRTYGRPFLAAVPFLCAATWIDSSVNLRTLLGFFSVVAVLTITYLPFVYFIALEPAERKNIRNRVWKSERSPKRE